MSPAWIEIVIFVVGMLAGAATNLFILGVAIGRYEQTVKSHGDKITKVEAESDRQKSEIEKFSRIFAALTGEVNGVDYGKLGGR